MHISILLESNKVELSLKADNEADQRLLTALHQGVRHMSNGRFHFINNDPRHADSSLGDAGVTLNLEPAPETGPDMTATEINKAGLGWGIPGGDGHDGREERNASDG